MINIISIKTRFGWISAFETGGKIFRVKFGKHKNRSVSKNLIKFKVGLKSFLARKNKSIQSNFIVKGNDLMVLTFVVTSSPIVPSPLVTAE